MITGSPSLPFSFFPPRQLFACLFLSRLPHYLRAWKRLTLRRRRISVWQFLQVKLCLFNLNLSMKPMKKFFVYECKLVLALLYLTDTFINKLTEWFQIQKEVTTPFEGMFPQGLSKCLQKFFHFLSVRKRDDRSVICSPKLESLAAINE